MSTTGNTDDDLASGWDLPEAEPATSSLTTESNDTAAWDAAADELDAGWDIEPSQPPIAPRVERPQRERPSGKATAEPRRPPGTKPSPLGQPSTKKLERVMSRKQREREAQAKAKREAERKAQRKLEQVKRAEHAATLRAAEARKSKEPRVSRPKPAPTRPRPESRSKAPPAADDDRERPEPSRREPAESTRGSGRKRKARNKARAKQRRIIGGVVALVALGLVVLFVWKLAR